MTHPADLAYAVDDMPPPAKPILLGLQQVMIMAMDLVMVAIVVCAARVPAAVARSAVSLGMPFLAMATILQALWKRAIGAGSGTAGDIHGISAPVPDCCGAWRATASVRYDDALWPVRNGPVGLSRGGASRPKALLGRRRALSHPASL
jgi:hypothetical protein